MILHWDFSRKFENNFKKLINVKYCIGVGSGTDAIYMSLKCLGLSNNDEVITSPYTFYATAINGYCSGRLQTSLCRCKG